MPEVRRVPVDKDRKKDRAALPSFGEGPLPETPPAAAPEGEPEPLVECDCPQLDASDWHEVESDWEDIAFVKGATSAVLGVPIGYGENKRELAEKARNLGASIPEHAMFLMGSGRFRRPVLLEVEDAPESKDIERPGGVVFTRLVPAPWGEMKSVVEQTEEIAKKRYGRKADDIWLWYLTCRECSGERNFETLIIAHYRERK